MLLHSFTLFLGLVGPARPLPFDCFPVSEVTQGCRRAVAPARRPVVSSLIPRVDVAAGLVVSAAGLGEPQRLALDLVGCGGLGSRVAVLLGDRDRAVHAKFPATGTRQRRLGRAM